MSNVTPATPSSNPAPLRAVSDSSSQIAAISAESNGVTDTRITVIDALSTVCASAIRQNGSAELNSPKTR